jgi:hypothetical protein
LNLISPHVLRVTLAVEDDEPADPVDVRVLGPQRIVTQPNGVANPVQETPGDSGTRRTGLVVSACQRRGSVRSGRETDMGRFTWVRIGRSLTIRRSLREMIHPAEFRRPKTRMR